MPVKQAAAAGVHHSPQIVIGSVAPLGIQHQRPDVLQRGKHHSKPSVSEDSQVSSATQLQAPGSHAANAARQHEHEDEVTSPHMGSTASHHAALQGQPMQPSRHASAQAQPMQLDDSHQHGTQAQMDIDSPPEPDSTSSLVSGGMVIPQGTVPKCSWPKAGAGGANVRQQHAGGSDLSDAALLERLDTGYEASASSQSAAQASETHTHSTPHSPAQHVLAQPQGQFGEGLAQGSQAGLWQGQVQPPGGPGSPIHHAASTAAMLALAQQASQSAAVGLQQSKRKHTGTAIICAFL